MILSRFLNSKEGLTSIALKSLNLNLLVEPSVDLLKLSMKFYLGFIFPQLIGYLLSLPHLLHFTLQLFFQGFNVFLGNSQLLLRLLEMIALLLGLLLELDHNILYALLSLLAPSQPVKGLLGLFLSLSLSLNGRKPSSFLLFGLSQGIIHPFLSDMRYLNSLAGRKEKEEVNLSFIVK